MSVCHLASKKHRIAPKLLMIYMSQKQFHSLKIPKHFLESMSPNPSSCMAHLQMHYAPDHSNFFLQAKTFLRPNFMMRTTNIQTLGLNLTNLKKHMTIKNERHITDDHLPAWQFFEDYCNDDGYMFCHCQVSHFKSCVVILLMYSYSPCSLPCSSEVHEIRNSFSNSQHLYLC